MSLYLGENLISGVGLPIEPTKCIGQMIQSFIPLTDAGLHLLDGSLIYGNGIYSDFVNYIADLYDSGNYSKIFTTEVNWQTSVTNYGSSSKFVYDSVNNTVRLPKRPSEHGVLIKSYSNETAWYRIYSDGWCEQGDIYVNPDTSAYSVTINLIKPYKDTNYLVFRNANESTSDTSATGNYYDQGCSSKTVSSFNMYKNGSNRSIKYAWEAKGYIDISDYIDSPIYEYIVMATSVKTEIEVDIDEVASDLNGKLETDLTNIISSGKSKIAEYAMPSDNYIELTPVAHEALLVTAPANGWVTIMGTLAANAWCAVGFFVGESTSISTSDKIKLYNISWSNAGASNGLGTFVPVKKGDKVYQVAINYSTSSVRFIYAEGEI